MLQLMVVQSVVVIQVTILLLIFMSIVRRSGILGEDSLIFGLTLKHEKYDQTFADKADNDRNSYGAYISYHKKFDDKF